MFNDNQNEPKNNEESAQFLCSFSTDFLLPSPLVSPLHIDSSSCRPLAYSRNPYIPFGRCKGMYTGKRLLHVKKIRSFGRRRCLKSPRQSMLLTKTLTLDSCEGLRVGNSAAVFVNSAAQKQQQRQQQQRQKVFVSNTKTSLTQQFAARASRAKWPRGNYCRDTMAVVWHGSEWQKHRMKHEGSLLC